MLIPRHYQIPLWNYLDGGGKRAVIVWHRRAGKDLLCWNYVVTEACTGRVGGYTYYFPNAALAKKIIWNGADKAGKRFLDYIPQRLVKRINRQELLIEFYNGSIIQLAGTDKSINVGTNPVGTIFSEFSLQNPRAWDYIRPILAENDGWALFNFTPRGRNFAYDLYEMARNNPDWFCQKLTVDDTMAVSNESIESERRSGMSEDLVQQEFYCFPKGQSVLCHDKVKDISEVKPGDLVFTHTGRFRKVLKTHERHYEGDLVRIKSCGSGEDILCTPNHPMRIYYRHSQTYVWKEAQYIEEKDRLVFPKLAKTYNVASKEFILAMAWYITEGSSSKTGLQFSLRDKDEARYVQGILDALGEQSAICNLVSGVMVTVCNTALSDSFRLLCGVGAHNKKIPLAILGEYGKDLLMELIKGDGCYAEPQKGTPVYIYTTVSKTLAYQVQVLANSSGFTSSIQIRKGQDTIICGKPTRSSESYCVRIANVQPRKETYQLNSTKYSVTGGVKEKESISYKGPVYNFQVEHDESYTINGRAVHNCSFDCGVQGAVFARQMEAARKENRIGHVAYDESLLVYTAWDIGIGDSTAIIFFQLRGDQILVIDHYENSGHALSHYTNLLKTKPWSANYGGHFVPHDAKHRSPITGGTYIGAASELGITMTAIPRDYSTESKIEISRVIFSRLYFDERKCDYLLKCLLQYHYEYDENSRRFRDRPEHDWSSHSADCLTYMCMAIKDGLVGYKSREKWQSIKEDQGYYGSKNTFNPIQHQGYA